MSVSLCRKATPVLYVQSMAPSLTFWCERLGFALTQQVPDGDEPVFAAVQSGDIEIMLQTVAAYEADPHAPSRPWRADRSYLFVEVGNLDQVIAALDGCEVVVPRQTTFYGADEIGYREPGGHFVTFACFAGAA